MYTAIQKRFINRIRNEVQQCVVALNGTPIAPLLAWWYALGLRLLLNALRRVPGLQTVYGTGSYFFGAPLYGHSDIDLILVFDATVHRYDPQVVQLRERYRQLRTLFPFLGSWSEQRENLVFLRELQSNGVLPSSLRFRLHHRQLRLLQGTDDEIRQRYQRQPLLRLAALDELAVLLQYLFLRSDHTLQSKLFWTRMAARLRDVASVFSTAVLEIPAEETSSQRLLSSEQVSPQAQFEQFLHYVAHVQQLALASDTAEYTIAPLRKVSTPSKHFVWQGAVALQWVEAAPLLSDCPQFLHFDTEQHVPLLSLTEHTLAEVRTLLEAFGRLADYDAVLLCISPLFVLLVHKEKEAASITALPALRFPLAFASLDGGTAITSAAINKELHELRNCAWNALADSYSAVAQRIDPYPFPCVYREDERKTLRDMLYLWRIRQYVRTGLDATCRRSLLQELEKEFPEARILLTAVAGRYGIGGSAQPANNLYRCLHEFTAQLFAGSRHVQLSAVQQHVGCSIGIVTRNRAEFLEKALQSLVEQQRPADEIVLIDNASQDATPAVVRRFQRQLPIVYHRLESGSVTVARNAVLRIASHEVICFIDDDCVVEPQWLAAIERAFLRAENIGIVGGSVGHQPLHPGSALDHYYRYFHHSLGVS